MFWLFGKAWYLFFPWKGSATTTCATPPEGRTGPGPMGRFTGPTPLSLGHLDTRCPSVWKLVHQTCGLATLGRVHSWIFSVSAASWFCIWDRSNPPCGPIALLLPGYLAMASILIALSRASAVDTIFCCVSGIFLKGSNPWISHSCTWASWMGLVSFSNASLSHCMYYHAYSPWTFWIPLISAMPCYSGCGNWNSSMKILFISARVGICPPAWGSIDLMYHFMDMALKVVLNSTTLEASRVPLAHQDGLT